MTHSYSALYYPFIHFKDDGWLKVTALYWDRIGRIVPRDYETEDSDTVRALGDVIEILRPDWVRPEFGATFVEFVEEHGGRLRDRYGLHLRDDWPLVPAAQQPPAAGGPSGTDPRLGYVFYEKMTKDVRRVLADSGIALPDGDDPRWIGMHPRLTHVYMTALADQLAGERGLYPLTDETLDYLAVGGWTVERLAQALLQDVDLVRAEARAREVESVTAYIAMETVLPRDPARLPVDRILEFREKYPGERGTFQRYVTDFVRTRDWLGTIQDRQVLEQRLQDELGKELKPRLDDLRAKLKDAKIETVTGALAIQVGVPSTLTLGASLLGLAVPPLIGLLAGVALALTPILLDRRKAERQLKTSEAAYLLRLEENLRPRELLTDWIPQGLRRFRPAT